MYHIHRTKALILKRFEEEQNATFIIFTKSFGLIRARALGIRRSNSKLKSGLQEFFISNISLICGKKGFKIVGADLEKNLFDPDKKLSSQKVALIFKTILRFVHYEYRDDKLFDFLYKSLPLFKNSTKIIELELLIISTLMYHLGYISSDEIDLYMTQEDRTEDMLMYIESNKQKIVALINKAFKESHL